jgi:hypothetical protein
LGTIAGATIRALRREAIAQLVDTRATPGTGATALANLLDATSPIVDHGFQIAIGGGMTDADQHGGEIDNAFQTSFRQGRI